MRKIFKYEVPIDDAAHALLMPKHARIVHVEAQTKTLSPSDYLGARCTFWAEVDADPGALAEMRTFQAFGTGQEIPEGTYRGTVLIGPLVFHLYEISESEADHIYALQQAHPIASYRASPDPGEDAS
ncbi:hypothetical protein SEA_POPPER_63 [Arthrobacter phage Popper]|uniref:DUF7352 domain-containing protein n=1 Tax=Arthrobacter phage Popper TaxID=2859633 RepID=A0AAE7WDC2_9CAUD|nr:hypothetical protein QEO78_gp43 [Arthrobacter phage Popper]QYC54980.1 hypothetical protein SEA_POPPER_63 [Arthrobacter phage Popper]